LVSRLLASDSANLNRFFDDLFAKMYRPLLRNRVVNCDSSKKCHNCPHVQPLIAYSRFMKIRFITKLLILAAVLIHATVGFAFETDQFNMPPEPLADIGVEVSVYTEGIVLQAVSKVNTEITELETCLKSPTKNCDSIEKTQKRLLVLRSDDAVAREVAKVLGGGIVPYTNSGSWLESNQFKAQPARFKPGFRESPFVFYPTSYFELASTIKMFDVQFGTDKIAHLFREGFGYFENYKKAINKGLPANEALQKAVKSGQKSERGIYGTFISGVFSNGDLAADYVGFKFYQGFTEDLRIDDKIRPSLLKLVDGIWIVNADFVMSDMLLKPFISNHLNEALNPSGFTKLFGLKSQARKVLTRNCPEWRIENPDFTQADFENLTNSLKRWNNEDYGFTEKKDFITIANTCFGNS
jgi:hypothetical protein